MIIKEVKGKTGIKEFIRVPYRIYGSNDKKVFSIELLQKGTLLGKNNPLLRENPHKFFIVYDDKGNPVGRILAGVNEKLNKEKNQTLGFISLFESINDKSVAFLLFDEALKYLKEKGVDLVKGPASPTEGDEDRGLLIEGFEYTPTIMNVYNPPYYVDFFEEYGFQKDTDFYAFLITRQEMNIERCERAVPYAMEKFHFRIDPLDMKNLKKEVKDIHEVIVNSMPKTWTHLSVPDEGSILTTFKKLKFFIDESLVYIARSNDRPIGFVAAIPDYNRIIIKLKGKLTLKGVFYLLKERKNIDAMRIFLQFVVPEFQNKGVNSAMFYRLMLEAEKKGYIWGEGSTVAEFNEASIRSILGIGGKLYKTYRVYQKPL